jgi:hypothetical protein
MSPEKNNILIVQAVPDLSKQKRLNICLSFEFDL